MARVYDVVIVGAGIMGCCTAYELARRGRQVALLDKGHVGEGPTGQSSAIIRQHYSNPLTARMAHYSLHVFRDFRTHIGEDCGFRQIGFVVLVDARDAAGLDANLALQRQVGIRTERLSPAALREIMPDLETGDLQAAAYEPDSGFADPYLTVNAYAKAARRHGADVFQHTEVTGIRFRKGTVRGVDTTKGPFEAPQVLNCTGAWGARVAALAGVKLPVNACRVQVAFFGRPAGHEAPHPVVIDFTRSVYFRSDAHTITLAGRIDPAEANAVVDPDRYATHLDDDFVIEVGSRLVQRYPAMEQGTSRGGFASLYAVTPDWHPVIDEVPAGSGFFVCTGFSGHGFKLGPAVGVLTADLLTGTPDPLFDPHPFRLSRFAEADPVRGQYAYSILG